MSLESEIALLTTATTDLLTAVNVSKASLDGKVEAATTQADLATAQVALAATQADLATAQVALATTQADLATTNGQAQVSIATTKAVEASASASSTAGVVSAAQLAATQANAAKDLAITAWAASTAPAETIAALSQVMHLGTVVDVCIDRPSTHSDGGAWIDRCQDKSWYTEALGGNRWLPAQATIAAAWTAAGSATGAVFQASATAGPLTLGKFYAATSATTATEVFRGIKREYPRAGVAWVAEAARVIGYDIGTGAMWRVTTGYDATRFIHDGYAKGITSIAAKDGKVVIGISDATDTFGNYGGGLIYDYAAGTLTKLAGAYSDSGYGVFALSRSNSVSFTSVKAGTRIGLVHGIVNDVAITTLENSPIDPATGMPVPTIAVATDGNATYSVSVIKDDGTVANIASDSTGTAVSVEFDGKALKVIRSDGTVYIWNDVTGIATGTAPIQTLTAATVPALLGAVSKQATHAKGSSTGLTRIQRNPTTLANSMVATAGYNFASGWQIGDSRLATICAADGVTESVVGGTIPDRSVKNVSLNVNGTLTKTPVAAGAALCALSGFSAANYLWQPYNSQLDFGLLDFSIIGWANLTSVNNQNLIDRYAGSNARIALGLGSAGALYFSCSATGALTTNIATLATGLQLITMSRVAGAITITVNTATVYSGTGYTNDLSSATAKLVLGNSAAHNAPTLGSLALWRISATAPSADQIAQIYRDELPLFQPAAQCTLAGTSPAVTALAYDDTTDILHVGTSYGRSSFKNLLRVESEATTVGAPTALAASGGTVIMAGTSAKLYTPAKYLRDELQRREESRRALGRLAVFFPYAAVTSQVAFPIPAGYTVKAVYSAGVIKGVGSTLDYTTNTDGYKETVTFAVAPGNTVQVTVMATRS